MPTWYLHMVHLASNHLSNLLPVFSAKVFHLPLYTGSIEHAEIK